MMREGAVQDLSAAHAAGVSCEITLQQLPDELRDALSFTPGLPFRSVTSPGGTRAET